MMSQQGPAKSSKAGKGKGKNHFRGNKRRQFIEIGQHGFLATCNFREKDCVRECYNILNQYADKLYGPIESTAVLEANCNGNEATALSDTDDISDALQNDVSVIVAPNQHRKDAVKKRFQVVDTGTTNCIFIRTTLPNPNELCTHIVEDIVRSQELQSRFILRLIPVEIICRANIAAIKKAGEDLVNKHFVDPAGTLFSVVFNRRFNNDLRRMDVIQALAALVTANNSLNHVSLKQPLKTVNVEVIKGFCCLSVIEGYWQHKKYNLMKLANLDDNADSPIKHIEETVHIEESAVSK